MKKMNKKGFTIVELVIVIAVIAILAAVMIPTFGGIISKANNSSVQQAASSLYKQAIALDLADGVQDGKDGDDEIEFVEGKPVTYEVDANGKVTKFQYTDASKKLTATTTNGSKWDVTTATSDELAAATATEAPEETNTPATGDNT
ncbi:MAG: type II secretion system protein [Clostridia bacterium]|nr:type II secretion system protein [Clostridia bacterium]